MSAGHEVRIDERFLLRSALAFAVFTLSGACTVLWGCYGGDKSEAFPVVFLGCLVVMVISAFYVFCPLILYYRCPLCRRRLRRVKEVRRTIRYDCPDCRIEWDLVWRRA